jgi:hypothetical protein
LLPVLRRPRRRGLSRSPSDLAFKSTDSTLRIQLTHPLQPPRLLSPIDSDVVYGTPLDYISSIYLTLAFRGSTPCVRTVDSLVFFFSPSLSYCFTPSKNNFQVSDSNIYICKDLQLKSFSLREHPNRTMLSDQTSSLIGLANLRSEELNKGSTYYGRSICKGIRRCTGRRKKKKIIANPFRRRESNPDLPVSTYVGIAQVNWPCSTHHVRPPCLVQSCMRIESEVQHGAYGTISRY